MIYGNQMLPIDWDASLGLQVQQHHDPATEIREYGKEQVHNQCGVF